MSKYTVKVKDGDEEVDEEVEVDTDKQTEKFHIPETNYSNAGEVDVVYDFKRVINLLHLYFGHYLKLYCLVNNDNTVVYFSMF